MAVVLDQSALPELGSGGNLCGGAAWLRAPPLGAVAGAAGGGGGAGCGSRLWADEGLTTPEISKKKMNALVPAALGRKRFCLYNMMLLS